MSENDNGGELSESIHRDEDLTPRDRCPECGDPVFVESEDPLDSDGEVSESFDREIHDDLMDSPDSEYELGGLFLGSEWLWKDQAEKVEKIVHGYERHEGERAYFPQLVMKYSGHHVRVESFRGEILAGRGEPSNDIAYAIREVICRD